MGKLIKVANLSDIHFRFEDTLKVNIALREVSNFKPDVIVLNGDIYDCYTVSDYDKDPLRRTTIQDEFDGARWFINAVDKLAKKVVFIQGNHENRFNRMFSSHPGLYDLRALEFAKAAELPSRWVVLKDQEFYTLGDMVFLHGNLRGSSERSINPAMTLLKYIKKSLICGHYHRFGAFYDTTYEGLPIIGHMSGHMSDVSKAKFITKPNWQSGWSEVYIKLEGGGFEVRPRIFWGNELIS